MGYPSNYWNIFFLFEQFQKIKTVDFIGIRTQMVREEDEHADHFTTITSCEWNISFNF